LHAKSSKPAKLPEPEGGSEILRGFARATEPIAIPDLSEDSSVSAGDSCPGVEAGPALYTPLRQRDALPAYIAVYRRPGRARFTTTDARIMLLLGAWLTTAPETFRLATGTEKLTVTDDLTEVYNQRFLKSALRREIQRA